LRLCLGFPNICFNLFGSVLPTTFPTTLEEVLSATPPPNPPATSKIISPLFAYCPQEFNIPPVLPSSCNPAAMKPEELSTFKASVENNLGYNIENTPNYQHTISNAAAGLHDDGKTGGI
jgi:hypothetical protein